MLKKLTLGNMPLIEYGLVEKCFDAELVRMVKDCEERPLDKHPRILTLTVRLTPDPQVSGSGPFCNEVRAEFEVTGKVPIQRTRFYAMNPKADGSRRSAPRTPTSSHSTKQRSDKPTAPLAGR